MSDSDDYFGPPLPPDMMTAPPSTSDKPASIQGHSLPHKHKPSRHSDTESSDTDSDSSSDSDGKEESPRKRVKVASADGSSSRQIGPTLPTQLQTEPSDPGASSSSFIGPVVPSGHQQSTQSDSDDQDCIGPMPSSLDPELVGATAAQEFERRAQKMKNKMLKKDEGPEVAGRETWMMELPPEMTKNFGLGPRKFSKSSGRPKGEDRSMWTDTPADRERKAQEASEGRAPKRTHHDVVPTERDRIFAGQVEDYNKTIRQESLMDMHTKKLEKKKKKKEKKEHKKERKEKKKKKEKDKGKDKKKSKTAKVERRAFDRELDLQVNRLDDARRKALIKRSAELNSKFGRGQQQFL